MNPAHLSHNKLLEKLELVEMQLQQEGLKVFIANLHLKSFLTHNFETTLAGGQPEYPKRILIRSGSHGPVTLPFGLCSRVLFYARRPRTSLTRVD